MGNLSLDKIAWAIGTISCVLAAGCTAPMGAELASTVDGKADGAACEGATFDSGGRCRLPNGRFAERVCCERALLADCISETEECMGEIEDVAYAEACGDEPDGAMCVSTTACPDWVFHDPDRTPHEILGLDITDQCHYVCADFFPRCMSDWAYDRDYDVDAAVASCIEESGCTSDLCTQDAALCDDARASFEETRADLPPDPGPTDPPPVEHWTLDRCVSETEECLGETEDVTYMEACGDEPDGAVCVNEESCPPEVFSDPDRTPLEVLGLDISDQCSYICQEYLPDCMFDRGFDDVTVEDAFSACIVDSGCPSDICDSD